MGDVGKYTLTEKVEKLSNDAKNIIKNITSSPIEKMMSTYITQEEKEKIPNLTYQQENTPTREFIVFINGLYQNPSTIKLFKWVAQM